MVKLEDLQKSINIVELLEKDYVSEIGEYVVNGYKLDEDSRLEWQQTVTKAMDIAKQKHEKKNTPWENASNIKFPLITKAAIDYAARTIPEIIQGSNIVKTNVMGLDQKSEKYLRGERVSKFMSWQLLVDSPDWEASLDDLLQMLPVTGTVFKKVYYDAFEDRVVSQLCEPSKIVVNYNTQSLDKARRITHVMTMYQNDIIERQRKDIFNKDVDPETLRPSNVSTDDEDFPIEILEQHCWMDLDDDGYKEPYIVFVHKESRQVLRIVNRFKRVEKTSAGKVLKIIPENYFIDYHFIPSPDGGFYSMGFGTLLLPLNHTINTIYNQLIDSGTLSNMQGGFVGRGLRIRNGEFAFKMGEWKMLDVGSGTDIAKNIYPLPTKEPSQVLFSLLSLTLQVSADLTSATDANQGRMPATNVSSGTLSQLVEQGTKVFTAINKRCFRSLGKEFKRVYDLNGRFIKQKHYSNVLDDPNADIKKDFEEATLDIYPIADPYISSDSQRVTRAGMIQSLRTADPRQADMLLLQSLHFDAEQIQRLLPPQDPNAPPPPEVQKIMAQADKMQAESHVLLANMQLEMQKLQLEMAQFKQAQKESDARILESAGRTWKAQQDALHGTQKVQIAAAKMTGQQQLQEAQLAHQVDKDQADTIVAVTKNTNDLVASLKDNADKKI